MINEKRRRIPLKSKWVITITSLHRRRSLAGADKLLLLTDQQGCLPQTRAPTRAELITDVHGIDDARDAIAGDSVSGPGTGGMGTKLQAAMWPVSAGIDTSSLRRQPSRVIGDVMEGILPARASTPRIPLEKPQTLIFGAPPAGELTVG